MRKRVLCTAVAAIFAGAIASAQSTGLEGQAGHHGERQLVTIEGCLQQQEGTTSVGNAAFVLQNARMARGAAEAVGTSGTSASADDASRADSSSADRPGAHRPRAGNAREEDDSTARRHADRSAAARGEEEAVGTSGRAGAMTNRGSASSYEIAGLDDERLQEHVGQRVQVQGYFEEHAGDHSRGSAVGRGDADRPRGETPTAGAPTEPTGTTGTGIAGHGTGGSTAPGASGGHGHDRTTAGQPEGEKRLRATSIRPLASNCEPSAR